jgi:glycosyltransferase involved in cell wall biosynthesis
MLSILIPSFNYNTFPLVQELHQQLLREHIAFEIIVGDDASTDSETAKLNQQITTLSHCILKVNPINLGRGSNRNALCNIAAYSWILFLDCDTIPTSSQFIRNYLDCINRNDGDVFFGGIAYNKARPDKEELLRWIYGGTREAIPVNKRRKKSYDTTLVSNILVKKQVLLDYPFHAEIYDYGFEDFVFIAELERNHIPIFHLDNTVYHLNLEKSQVFLEKHLKALDNLNKLIEQQIISPNETALSRLRKNIVRLKLTGAVANVFKLLEPKLRSNLISDNPSLLLFDFYKLGYFCSIKKL